MEIKKQFDDFADITEYYYDELGKLEELKDSVSGLKRKEAKRLHNYIVQLLFASIDNNKAKSRLSDKIDKTELKEYEKEFDYYHKKPSIWQKIARPMQKIVTAPARAIGRAMAKRHARAPNKIEQRSSLSLLEWSGNSKTEDD